MTPTATHARTIQINNSDNESVVQLRQYKKVHNSLTKSSAFLDKHALLQPINSLILRKNNSIISLNSEQPDRRLEYKLKQMNPDPFEI